MNMSLKDFRKNYGQNLSMTVCNNAHIYFMNGHQPKPGIGTASVIYAKDFIDKPLHVIGYRVKEEQNCVKIYGMLTETVGAQNALQKGNWDYENRCKCIAGLGENYLQIWVKSLQFSDDAIVSIYNHKGQYVAVVALEGCTKPSQVEDFKQIGHVIAVNSLLYYNRYLNNVSPICSNPKNAESDCHGCFLKMQSIELKPNPESDWNGTFSPENGGLDKYLDLRSQQLGVGIHLSGIYMFGNFEDL